MTLTCVDGSGDGVLRVDLQAVRLQEVHGGVEQLVGERHGLVGGVTGQFGEHLRFGFQGAGAAFHCETKMIELNDAKSASAKFSTYEEFL